MALLDNSRAMSLLRCTVFDDLADCWSGDDARRAAWEFHRETLLLYWVQEDSQDFDTPSCLASANVCSEYSNITPAGPFYRPLAWWNFEAPPRLCAGCGGVWGEKCECEETKRESTAAYLQRTGSLLPGEMPTEADLRPEPLSLVMRKNHFMDGIRPDTSPE